VALILQPLGPMSDRDPLFDPPDADGLRALREGIAFRLSASFASLGRPGRTARQRLESTIPLELIASNADSIPTLSDSLVQALTDSALMEAS